MDIDLAWLHGGCGPLHARESSCSLDSIRCMRGEPPPRARTRFTPSCQRR